MNGRQVETVFVFDRHAATDLSVAYGILVPQRRARTGRAGQEGLAAWGVDLTRGWSWDG